MDFTPRITTVGDVFGISARVWVASLQIEFTIIVSWDYDRAAFNLMIIPGLGDLEGVLGESAKKTISIKPTGFANCLARDPDGTAAPPQQPPHWNRQHHRQPADQGRQGSSTWTAWALSSAVCTGSLSTTHAFDCGGYKTSFKVRKEVWFGGIPVPKGPGGLVRVQGQSIG